MVVKSEACCQKCNTESGFFSPLRYDASSQTFTCSHNKAHRFRERTDGYLQSI